MVFNSLTYLILLLIVVPLYWYLSYNKRLLLIFISSLIFYGFWKIEFILLVLVSVCSGWYFSHKIFLQKNIKKRKKLLLASLAINLGILVYFKYLIFLSQSFFSFVNLIGLDIGQITLNIILPLGISFYTFQNISYLVDVYRKNINPEKNFILFSCYITFFPQLVAGPILRANEVIPQFKNRAPFSIDNISIGVRRILYGLFLKVVLADQIAGLVDEGFSVSAYNLAPLDVWTLSFLFGFQIYFDFSGYSHIAIGSARLIGIRFPENFNFPYLSHTPKEFWKRWHISLSSWVRDYLYLPLIGKKNLNKSLGGISVAIEKTSFFPLLLVWSLMGFWHGANWTFLIWGLYHAIFIFTYRLAAYFTLDKFVMFKNKILSFLITLPLIMLSWIPFRSHSINETFVMWLKVFDFGDYLTLNLRENTYLITAILAISIFIVYMFNRKIIPYLKKSNYLIKILDIIFIAIITIFVFIFFQRINQFIYFQF